MKSRLTGIVYPAIYDTLNEEQALLADKILKAVFENDPSNHFYIQGKAGSGKTYTFNVIALACSMNSKTIVKAAFTGVIASQIKGETLNSLFRLPPMIVTPEPDEGQVKNAKEKISRIDVIFIDEISMVRIDAFENIMRQIAIADDVRAERGLAPICVIVCGDFNQLSPVVTTRDRFDFHKLTGRELGSGFCYESELWSEMSFVPFFFKTSMRQPDANFVKLLGALRFGGEKADAAIKSINKLVSKEPFDNGVWLCGKNDTVNGKNSDALSKLPGIAVKSKAVIEGAPNLIKRTNLSSVVEFKKGAKVMMLQNDKFYSNGSFGVITEIIDEKTVIVAIDNGAIVTVAKSRTPILEARVDASTGTVRPMEIGAVNQFPFMLGYAVSIHKAQGQTFDFVNIAPEIFASGQLYTALSRCTEIGHIFLERPLTKDDNIINRKVASFVKSQIDLFLSIGD